MTILDQNGTAGSGRPENHPKMRFFAPYSSARRDQRPPTTGMGRVRTPTRVEAGSPWFLQYSAVWTMYISKKWVFRSAGRDTGAAKITHFEAKISILLRCRKGAHPTPPF